MSVSLLKKGDYLEIEIIKTESGYEVVVAVNKKIIANTEIPYFSAIKHYVYGVLKGIEKEVEEADSDG